MNMEELHALYPYMQKIEAFLAAHVDWSQNQLANEMDISKGQMSQYVNLKVHQSNGNLERLNEKIKLWFEKHDEAQQYFEEDLLTLRITEEIQDFISISHSSGECALLFGPSGLGKTIAAKEYAEKNDTAVYIEATNSYSSTRGVIALLYEELSGSILRYTATYGFSYLKKSLPLKDKKLTTRLVIIDQAHRLCNKAIQEVQALYDATGVPFVLLGTPTVCERLRDGKSHEILAEMASRITIIKQFPLEPYSEDLKKYCSMYGVNDKHMVDFLAQKARFGGLRIVKGVLRKAKKQSLNGVINMDDLLFSASISQMPSPVPVKKKKQ